MAFGDLRSLVEFLRHAGGDFRGVGDAPYGILFGAVFVGLGLGMGLGPRVARDLSRRRLFGLSIIFAGVCLVLVALMPHLLLSLVFVIGVAAIVLGAKLPDGVDGSMPDGRR